MPEIRRIPRVVWALGFVSMCMDLSSEIIHALLPMLLVTGLGASALVLGLIEGAAEATASFSKLYSGWLSDRLGRRKVLVLSGYALAALTKPVFPLAATPFQVFLARFADRIGKGIRGAPRDALIADATPAHMRGAAYGLRQSLDTVGAFLGPLAAIGLMFAFSGDYRAVMWLAVVPAIASVLIIIFLVEDAPAPIRSAEPKQGDEVNGIARLGGAFWLVAIVGCGFSLARFSEAFLLLKAGESGLPLMWVPIVMVVMNAVYSLVSVPAGRWADLYDRQNLLAAGLVVLILADVVLALGSDIGTILIGAALWGVHMGLTQGLLSALVADAAPAGSRGSAFGVFHFLTGVSLLLASAIAGALWTYAGAPVAFLTGALFAALTLMLMLGRSQIAGLFAWLGSE